jgi:hypothetical protein
VKYHPRYIIYFAVSRYLDDRTCSEVWKKFGTEFPKQDRKFLSIMKQHFNFELMKDKPFIWQDIWIYNYLKYDYDGHKFKRSGLLAKYERDIVIPSEKTYLKALAFLGIKDKTQATDHT